jgi:hypothetical protein
MKEKSGCAFIKNGLKVVPYIHIKRTPIWHLQFRLPMHFQTGPSQG